MSDYQSMDCPNCIRKHIAAAISYAKEILAGHGAGGDPDHRADLLGELGNAEHHLCSSTTYREIFDRMLELRRMFEDHEYIPYNGMITELRKIWTELSEHSQNTLVRTREVNRTLIPRSAGKLILPANLVDRGEIDVLLLPGNSKDELDGIKQMISNNVQNVKNVHEGALSDSTTEYVLVWPAHTGIIRKINGGVDCPIYVKAENGESDWYCKPQLVKRTEWIATPSLAELLRGKEQASDNVKELLIDMRQKVSTICCGTKTKFRSGAYFVRWKPENWPIIANALTPQMRWPD